MATSWKDDYRRYKGLFLNILEIYQKKPNIKIYLELILSIVTITIFAIFAIRPTLLTIIELTNEIRAKEETSAKLQQKLVNLQSASRALSTLAPELLLIDQAVPDTAVPDLLVKQIENLSINSSLNIVGLSVSEVTLLGTAPVAPKGLAETALPEGSSEVPITFSVSGTYQNIMSFLTQIENLRRPIKIDAFIVNSNVTDDGKVLVLTIVGRTPYLLN